MADCWYDSHEHLKATFCSHNVPAHAYAIRVGIHSSGRQELESAIQASLWTRTLSCVCRSDDDFNFVSIGWRLLVNERRVEHQPIHHRWRLQLKSRTGSANRRKHRTMPDYTWPYAASSLNANALSQPISLVPWGKLGYIKVSNCETVFHLNECVGRDLNSGKNVRIGHVFL